MANLGSDVSQLFSHIEKGETRLAASAVKRARKIIEELLAHDKLMGRTGEVEILRDIINDAFSGKRLLDVSRDELEEYFLPFCTRITRQLSQMEPVSGRNY